MYHNKLSYINRYKLEIQNNINFNNISDVFLNTITELAIYKSNLDFININLNKCNNLKTIIFRNCDNLKYIDIDLSNIKELIIIDCNNLINILSDLINLEILYLGNSSQILIDNLFNETRQLDKLYELRYSSKKNNNTELSIYNCNNLKILYAEPFISLNFKYINIYNSLTELYISGQINYNILNKCNNLSTLELSHTNISNLNVINKSILNNIHTLRLVNEYYITNITSYMPNLKILKVVNCKNISKLYLIKYPNLTSLSIDRLIKLTNIPLFKNLQKLTILDCYNIIRLPKIIKNINKIKIYCNYFLDPRYMTYFDMENHNPVNTIII